jgi:hypothetical protein
MNFELSELQKKKYLAWKKRKEKKTGEVYVGAIGGAYTFCFTPTSIGTIVEVTCTDGAKIDLTDHKEFM